MQEARAAARNILDDVAGVPRRPFSYFDKGFMATIGRARAVAQLGKLRLSGLLAWLAWVFVHLWYLIGFRNRLSVMTNWIWAYVVSRHGARVITGRRASAREDLSRASAVAIRAPDSGADRSDRSRA